MKKIFIIIILFLICIFLYGKYIEINKLKVNYYNLSNSNIPESFQDLKIVQFSDLLYNKDEKKLNKIIDKINNENADIIIFSGDLFNGHFKYSDNDINVLKEALKKLNANLYKFAIYGDNDLLFKDIYKDLLYDANFKLLDNENMLLFYKDNTPINIIGINDLNELDNLTNPEIAVNYTIAITHKPDNATTISNKNINTIMAGHNLGGIINLPFIGGLIKKEGAKTYFDSYYKINDTELFISNGLGYDSFNFRLFNAPSINVYKFKK